MDPTISQNDKVLEFYNYLFYNYIRAIINSYNV